MAEKDLGKCTTGIQPNVAGLLCYSFGFITGIIFYLIEKDNKFVRFHAMQSIIVFVGLAVLQSVANFVPVGGLFLWPLIGIGGLVLWIVLMVKAYQGEKFKLPGIGDIAEKQS